jgi:hypothetical protein
VAGQFFAYRLRLEFLGLRASLCPFIFTHRRLGSRTILEVFIRRSLASSDDMLVSQNGAGWGCKLNPKDKAAAVTLTSVLARII